MISNSKPIQNILLREENQIKANEFDVKLLNNGYHGVWQFILTCIIEFSKREHNQNKVGAVSGPKSEIYIVNDRDLCQGVGRFHNRFCNIKIPGPVNYTTHYDKTVFMLPLIPQLVST